MNLVLAPAFTQKKLPNLNISVTSSSSGNRGISSLIATIASSSRNSSSCSSSRFKSRTHNHSSNHLAVVFNTKKCKHRLVEWCPLPRLYPRYDDDLDAVKGWAEEKIPLGVPAFLIAKIGGL